NGDRSILSDRHRLLRGHDDRLVRFILRATRRAQDERHRPAVHPDAVRSNDRALDIGRLDRHQFCSTAYFAILRFFATFSSVVTLAWVEMSLPVPVGRFVVFVTRVPLTVQASVPDA